MMTVPSLFALLFLWRFGHAQESLGALPFIGAGYNILSGNPEGEQTAQIDPGLMPKRRVLQLHFRHNKTSVDGKFLIADEVAFDYRRSCVDVTETSIITGTEGYQTKLAAQINITGTANHVLADFAFSQSQRFKIIHRKTIIDHEVLYEEKTTCSLGRVRYLLGRASTPLTQAFTDAVCRLPQLYSAIDYVTFIDKWGTHIVIGLQVGKQQIKRYKTTRREFARFSLENAEVVSAKNLSAYFTEDMRETDFNSSSNVLFTSGGSDVKLIGLSIVSIDIGLDIRFHSFFRSGCGLSKEALKTRQVHLQKSLRDYPALKQAQPSKDPACLCSYSQALSTFCSLGGRGWDHRLMSKGIIAIGVVPVQA
ncbi:uncharacterized protein LOC5519144 isoform X2 [Nematostella vectensis]|uniref:uncharacterized protein LOC5519144 isoform X2 n=1 Tax=Nematostella vectensis TaxID=45351 RepID=UPI00138FFFA8|nr:uncharacterized protein LOC5519144 isoform X2 [Nematostella vectensis]